MSILTMHRTKYVLLPQPRHHPRVPPPFIRLTEIKMLFRHKDERAAFAVPPRFRRVRLAHLPALCYDNGQTRASLLPAACRPSRSQLPGDIQRIVLWKAFSRWPSFSTSRRPPTPPVQSRSDLICACAQRENIPAIEIIISEFYSAVKPS